MNLSAATVLALTDEQVASATVPPGFSPRGASTTWATVVGCASFSTTHSSWFSALGSLDQPKWL